MERHHIRSIIVTAVLAAAVIVTVGARDLPAATGSFTVPCVEVKPQNGVFEFPADAFQDGKARHYVYKHAADQEIRFFIVKSVDGVIRAALDACDVCFRAKKGYVQQGNDMVCINCGMKFRTDKVNEVKGGCNPHPLNRTVKDGKVTIALPDVVAGLKYFQ